MPAATARPKRKRNVTSCCLQIALALLVPQLLHHWSPVGKMFLVLPQLTLPVRRHARYVPRIGLVVVRGNVQATVPVAARVIRNISR